MLDDCSSDNSLTILIDAIHKIDALGELSCGVEVYSLSINKGVSQARNFLSQFSSAEYLLFLDADDMPTSYLTSVIDGMAAVHSSPQSRRHAERIMLFPPGTASNCKLIPGNALPNPFDHKATCVSHEDFFDTFLNISQIILHKTIHKKLSFSETLSTFEDFVYLLSLLALIPHSPTVYPFPIIQFSDHRDVAYLGTLKTRISKHSASDILLVIRTAHPSHILLAKLMEKVLYAYLSYSPHGLCESFYLLLMSPILPASSKLRILAKALMIRIAPFRVVLWIRSLLTH